MHVLWDIVHGGLIGDVVVLASELQPGDLTLATTSGVLLYLLLLFDQLQHVGEDFDAAGEGQHQVVLLPPGERGQLALESAPVADSVKDGWTIALLRCRVFLLLCQKYDVVKVVLKALKVQASRLCTVETRRFYFGRVEVLLLFETFEMQLLYCY